MPDPNAESIKILCFRDIHKFGVFLTNTQSLLHCRGDRARHEEENRQKALKAGRKVLSLFQNETFTKIIWGKAV